MKIFGLDIQGKFKGQRVDTLPVWNSTDEGRLIYVLDSHKYYYGTNTQWDNLGESGYSGLSGYSGFSGSIGSIGISGYSGISGFSSYSGISGFSSYSGISGISGYSGVGTLGGSGYSGISGISGYSGTVGSTGGTGISGYSGISGISGYSGTGVVPQTIGFTISGGTTSKTLTVEDNTQTNQDLTTDSGPTFDHLHITNGADIGGYLTGQNKEIIMASTHTLDAVECKGTIINNYGQAADAIITLPPCAVGLSFIVLLGTTVANYYRLDPNASDSIFLNGVTTGAGKYVQIASAVQAASISFIAFQTGSGVYNWYASSISGTWVAEA